MPKHLSAALVAALASVVVALITTFGSIAASQNSLREATEQAEDLSQKIEAKTALAGVPVGTIVGFGGPLEQEMLERQGWLPCDGRAVSRRNYETLFETIGETWGRGDGVNTFSLPDLRGRFLRGVDAGSGRDSDAATREEASNGGNTGDQVGSIQKDSFQEHHHLYRYISDAGSGDHRHPTDRFNAGPNSQIENRVGNAIASSQDNPSRTSTETRPKNAYVYWLIRAR